MTGDPAGLTGVSLPALERLLAAITTRDMAVPLTSAGLARLGLDEPNAGLRSLLTLDGDGLATLLKCVIAERRRPVPGLDLVWTGPEARVSTARDTEVVLRELLAGAEQCVVIAGYRFDHGVDILRPLHARMRDLAVTATIVLDIEGRAQTATAVAAFANRAAAAFVRDNWPFGDPAPAIYYDPHTVTPGPWASMHAKCVVVDDRKALVTSANFTNRGQNRNIEVGVLIDDEAFARQLAGQWFGLLQSGLLIRAEVD